MTPLFMSLRGDEGEEAIFPLYVFASPDLSGRSNLGGDVDSLRLPRFARNYNKQLQLN
jgi:hypothetical protein